MFTGQAGSFPSTLGLLLKATENHPSFPAPHHWGAAVSPGADPRGVQGHKDGSPWLIS